MRACHLSLLLQPVVHCSSPNIILFSFSQEQVVGEAQHALEEGRLVLKPEASKSPARHIDNASYPGILAVVRPCSSSTVGLC